ncbi:unnamed protein product, partial [Polarella glacialis]
MQTHFPVPKQPSMPPPHMQMPGMQGQLQAPSKASSMMHMPPSTSMPKYGGGGKGFGGGTGGGGGGKGACHQFAQGSCTFGDSCKFSHGDGGSGGGGKGFGGGTGGGGGGKGACHQFAQGSCTFGDSCKFSHGDGGSG